MNIIKGHVMKSLKRWCYGLFMLSFSSLYASDEGLFAYRLGLYNDAAQDLSVIKTPSPAMSYYLAKMRLYGYGQLKNNWMAMANFKEAALRNYLPAVEFMGLYALDQNNFSEALAWFKKLADANQLKAQLYCAAAYTYGLGTSINEDLARKYYLPAARAGNDIAQNALANYFLNSKQLTNKKLGLTWLNKAVVQNNPEAICKLSELYTEGIVVPVDLAKAKSLAEQSFKEGYTPALYQLGKIAQKENNIELAKTYYLKSSMQHYSPAIMALAQMYLQSQNTNEKQQGFSYLVKAAQSGSKEAQLLLANAYKKGDGVEKNEVLAKQWEEKAKQKNIVKIDRVQEVSEWLSRGKAKNLVTSGYQLHGILTDWHNLSALKQNNYNQAPQMSAVSRTKLYQPDFSLINPIKSPLMNFIKT